MVIEGRAPAALPAAVAAHVAVALKQLGSSLVTSGAFDAEAAATCAFPPSTKVAHCLVVVARAAGARVERRAEIRYRDAEDLAESLALLVSDILTADFADIVGGARSVNPPATGPPPVGPPPPNPPPPKPTPPPKPGPPSPTVNPPPPPTPEEQKAHEAEMQRQLEIVRALQKQADQARVAREQAEAERRAREERQRPSPSRPKPPPQTRAAFELGAAGIFGLGPANPTLVGGTARALWARDLLRVGGSLSLAGMRQTLSGHDLSFIRTLVAARAGVGVRTREVDFDVTAGPALLVLVEDAHAEGRHAVASFAATVGPRLAVTLAGPLALVAGADLDVAVTDEKVTAGSMRVAQFSRASVELSLGIAWRSR